MSYRKVKNAKEIWIEYCAQNSVTLIEIGLDPSVYKTEGAFREWATKGFLETATIPHFSPNELSDEKFWLLHNFVTHFFDYDAVLFEYYERSRIARPTTSMGYCSHEERTG